MCVCVFFAVVGYMQQAVYSDFIYLLHLHATVMQ